MFFNTPYRYWAKFSKIEYYVNIIKLLQGENTNITIAEAVKFLKHEGYILEQKNNAKKERRAEKYGKDKEALLSVMKGMTEPLTCSEIQTYIPRFSISKISFLLNSMAGVEVIKSRRMSDGRALFMYNC